MHRNKIKTKTKTIKSATVVTHKITLFYYIIIISSTLLTTKQKRIGAKTKKNEREKRGNTYTYEGEKTAKFAIMKNGEENNNKKFKNYKRTYKTEKERNGIANCKMHAIDEKRYC